MESINNLTQEQNDYINKATVAGVLGPIYALASGLYREFWLFFIPFYNIYLFIKIIKDGRKMAWEKGNKDFTHFEYHQKNLSKIAKIVLGIFAGMLMFEIILFLSLFSGGGKDVAKSFTQSIFTDRDISSYTVSEFKPNQEYINFEKEKRGDYEGVTFSSFSVVNNKSELSGSVDFANTSMPICVNLEKIEEEWKVFNLTESCD